MNDIFTFPTGIDDPTAIDVPITAPAQWDDARIARTLAAFGVRERGRTDTGSSRLVVRGDGSELEIFRTSDSLRWSVLDDRTEEPAEPVALPTPEQARAQAAAALVQRELADPAASVQAVSDSVHSRIGAANAVLLKHPVARHVSYGYRLNGRPVFGPGAKLQVTFAGGSGPAQIYRFWRQPSGSRTFATIGYPAAVETVRRHRTFAAMVSAGQARVVFDRVALGYYAFPARERQGLLIPVYSFEGQIANPALEKPHTFTRYVTAVALSGEALKASAATARGRLPAFFSD